MYTWQYIKEAALAKLDLTIAEASVQNLIDRFPVYANEVMTQVCSSIKPKYSFASFEITEDNIGEAQDMPTDFISFGDDVCYQLLEEKYYNYAGVLQTKVIKEEIHDDDFEYCGYNQVIFKHPGKFYISYNARWYTFDKNIADAEVLKFPMDIADCIPSYIASQCYKIDDEYKASVFRNEYEIMLARIDDTDYRNTRTLKIEGDW